MRHNLNSNNAGIAPSLNIAKNLEDLKDLYNRINSSHESHRELSLQLRINTEQTDEQKIFTALQISMLHRSVTTLSHQFLIKFKNLSQEICEQHHITFKEETASFRMPDSDDHPYFEDARELYTILQDWLKIVAHFDTQTMGLSFDGTLFPPSDIYDDLKLKGLQFNHCKIGLNLSTSDLSNTRITCSTFTQESVLHLSQIEQLEDGNNIFHCAFDFQSYKLLKQDGNDHCGEEDLIQQLKSFVQNFQRVCQHSKGFKDFCISLHKEMGENNSSTSDPGEAKTLLMTNTPLLYSWSSFISIVLAYPQVIELTGNYLDNEHETLFYNLVNTYKIIDTTDLQDSISNAIIQPIENLALEETDLNQLITQLNNQLNSVSSKQGLALAALTAHYRRELTEASAGYQPGNTTDLETSNTHVASL